MDAHTYTMRKFIIPSPFQIFRKPWRERDINAAHMSACRNMDSDSSPESWRCPKSSRAARTSSVEFVHTSGEHLLQCSIVNRPRRLYGHIYVCHEPHTEPACGNINDHPRGKANASCRRFAINIHAFCQRRRLDLYNVMIYLPRAVIMYYRAYTPTYSALVTWGANVMLPPAGRDNPFAFTPRGECIHRYWVDIYYIVRTMKNSFDVSIQMRVTRLSVPVSIAPRNRVTLYS